MKFKNITTAEAKLYLEKFEEQVKRKTPDQILMQYLMENGVEKFETPYEVSWEITAECNLRCKHCCFSSQDYNSENDIDNKTAINFTQQLVEYDVIKVMITGGEPLFRKDLFDIIKLLKTKNITIELTTNAMLINNEIAKKLGELLNPLCDYIQVSLDGADENIHDKTRGNGSFQKAINGIKLLIANGVKVTINCVITNINMHQMLELYDLANNLGVHLITFSKIFEDINKKNLMPDNNLLWTETIKLIRHEKKELPINLRLFSFPEISTSSAIMQNLGNSKNKVKNFICNKREKIHIRKDGEVFLCLKASNKNLFSLGNIKKNTLADILNNMNENSLFLDRKLENSKCNKCTIQQYCKAGCPINAFLEKGSIYVADPTCFLEI